MYAKICNIYTLPLLLYTLSAFGIMDVRSSVVLGQCCLTNSTQIKLAATVNSSLVDVIKA